MSDRFLGLLALFLAFDVFIISCLKILLILVFGYHEAILNFPNSVDEHEYLT